MDLQAYSDKTREILARSHDSSIAEFTTYVSHGADEDLALTMTLLFHALLWQPDYIKQIKVVSEYSDNPEFHALFLKSESFKELLQSKDGCKKARGFLEESYNLYRIKKTSDNNTYKGLIKKVLDNVEEVQRILHSSREELDKLRKEDRRAKLSTHLI